MGEGGGGGERDRCEVEEERERRYGSTEVQGGRAWMLGARKEEREKKGDTTGK
jgi:hypothetical protein